MRTSTLAAETVQAPPQLDLDARLALAAHSMDLRLDRAAVAFEVNTAHIPAEPIDLDDLAPIPPLSAPATAPDRTGTPIAACLRRAHTRLIQAGWCTGALRDEQGATCLAGAIRAAAGDHWLAVDACAVLLDAIQREFAGAETVPSWNDQQADPRTVLRILGRAADHAEQQGI
jgi:hypothetical protein